MKKLTQLLKIGVLSIFIPLFTSYNANYVRIPLVEKLREIEQDKNIKQVVNCKHKSWRYYLNTKAKGYDMNLIIGWMDNSNVLHAYLKDNEGRVFDPTWKSNKDGFIEEDKNHRKDIYIFGPNTTIEDFVAYKNYESKDTVMYKRFKETKQNYKRRTLSQNKITNRIENYCKKDTAAWNYYKKNISKDKVSQ